MILVTGASGFIGGHLVKALIREGLPVRALVRTDKILPFPREKAEIFFGDITDAQSLIGAMRNVDTVFHLASVINFETESIALYQNINITGTENIFKAAAAAQVRLKRFVFCSSVGVFGPLAAIPANEETGCHPVNFYEKSKCETETTVHRLGKEMDIPVSIIRPSWVYGPGDRRTLKLFRAINRHRFLMIGRGATRVHPVYVTDLVQGIMQSAFKKGLTAHEIFIIAGRRSVSLRRLVVTLAAALNRKVPRIHVPVSLAKIMASLFEKAYAPLKKIPPISHRRLEFFVKSQAFDISRAMKRLGYTPVVDLDEGVLKTVKWYRDHDWL